MLSRTPNTYQANKLFKTCQKYLKDRSLFIFRLNTDFKELKLDMGRAFGFVYGDKENGSYFSHMNVMFAYGLLQAGIEKASRIITSLVHASIGNPLCCYPNLPEYFNLQKHGLYCYLTGSASWLIYTFLKQILGIEFKYGNLIITPKLKYMPKRTIKAFFTLQNKNFAIACHNKGSTLDKILFNSSKIEGKTIPYTAIKKSKNINIEIFLR